MVFVSKNLDRKCKWCNNKPKRNVTKEGRFKGYYRTCGNKKCATMQYRSSVINFKKITLKSKTECVCCLCGNIFIKRHANHKMYCIECVPDNTWRGRAKKYGIGKKQWDSLLEKQCNECALCSRNPEVVDHCHKTGKVRGILCGYCNMQIVKIDTDKEWLKRSLNYLGINYVSIKI